MTTTEKEGYEGQFEMKILRIEEFFDHMEEQALRAFAETSKSSDPRKARIGRLSLQLMPALMAWVKDEAVICKEAKQGDFGFLIDASRDAILSLLISFVMSFVNDPRHVPEFLDDFRDQCCRHINVNTDSHKAALKEAITRFKDKHGDAPLGEVIKEKMEENPAEILRSLLPHAPAPRTIN